MKNLNRIITLFTFLSVMSSVPSTAQKLSEIGINRSHLSAETKATQQKTFADIHALHANWFRDGPSSGSPQGVANFVQEVKLAKQQNLNILVNVVQMDEDYDIPLVKHSHGWNAKALSKISIVRFSQRFRTLLDALKAANLTIDAVEFGNEDDTFYYDADVPDGHLASPAEVHTWLRGYGEFLKTGAAILHDPRYYPNAKIITFGIAHGGNEKESFSNPAKIVTMLKDVDGFDYLNNTSYHVDGYGTHIYPSPNNAGGGATALLRQDISALGRNTSFWITEFGFFDPTKFPNKQGETLPQGLGDLLAAFDDLAQRVPIGPMMFYSYNSGLTDAKGNLSGLVDAGGSFVPAATVLSARAMKR